MICATDRCQIAKTLRWRHNERDGVSNHQPHDCLLNRLFKRRSKRTSKLWVTGLCEGNSPRKLFPFDDVSMKRDNFNSQNCRINSMSSDSGFHFLLVWAHSLQWRYMCFMYSRITGYLTVWWTACSGSHQQKHQRSTLLCLYEKNRIVTGRFLHKGSTIQNLFSCHDVIIGNRPFYIIYLCSQRTDLDVCFFV